MNKKSSLPQIKFHPFSRILKAVLFFIGWVLSPLTLWNDAFVNLPLSYLIANALFFIIHLPFSWLLLGSYWLTNFLGILFMYLGGKYFVLSSRDKKKSLIFLFIFTFLFSVVMIYLDKKGLLPRYVFK